MKANQPALPDYPGSITISPAAVPVDAVVRLPGSKSYTNRALLLAALAHGESSIRSALFSEDTHYMAEALELYAQELIGEGRELPRPRTLTELKADPDVADEIRNYMVALIGLPARAHAAE